MYSSELNSKIALWRSKQIEGTLTQEELKEFVTLLRQERRSAAEQSSKKRTRAKAEVKSADELLKELE
jgi:hypothetical protein